MNPKQSTEWVKTFGLDSATVYKGKPYFFLFADIDTKDEGKIHRGTDRKGLARDSKAELLEAI